MWLHLKQGWGALLGERPECLLGWWQYSVCCEVLVTQVYTFVKTYWSDEHLRSMDFIVCKLDLNKIFLKIKKLFYVLYFMCSSQQPEREIQCKLSPVSCFRNPVFKWKTAWLAWDHTAGIRTQSFLSCPILPITHAV